MAKQILGTVLVSPNGRDGWVPVAREAVPAWVQTPENMRRLILGEMCMKADEGDRGSDWFRFVPIGNSPDVERLRAAEDRRQRRWARRVENRSRIQLLH